MILAIEFVASPVASQALHRSELFAAIKDLYIKFKENLGSLFLLLFCNFQDNCKMPLSTYKTFLWRTTKNLPIEQENLLR